MVLFPFGQYVHQKTASSTTINVLQQIGLEKHIDHLGIQAPPGTSLTLNGQTITIGTSGQFEVEMAVSSLTAAQNQYFIIDYHYTTT